MKVIWSFIWEACNEENCVPVMPDEHMDKEFYFCYGFFLLILTL